MITYEGDPSDCVRPDTPSCARLQGKSRSVSERSTIEAYFFSSCLDPTGSELLGSRLFCAAPLPFDTHLMSEHGVSYLEIPIIYERWLVHRLVPTSAGGSVYLSHLPIPEGCVLGMVASLLVFFFA